MSRFGLVIKRIKEKPMGVDAVVPYGFMLNDGTTCMIFRKNLQLFIFDMTKERWYEIVSKPYETKFKQPWKNKNEYKQN